MADDAKDTSYGSTIGWGIILIIFAIIIAIAWHFLQEDIRSLVRWIRYAEMWVVSWFVGDDYQIWFKGAQYPFQEGMDRTPEFSKGELSRDHLSYFTALAMQPLKIPFTILFGALAIWALFRGPKTQYRQTLGLEGLIHRQAGNFGVISPFKDFNPSKQPPRPPGSPVPADLPLFAEALGPEEWITYHSIPVPDGNLDQLAAEKAFALQLGSIWRGPGRLEPCKQVLLAAFCLKAARKREQADDMLGRLSQCWEAKGGMKLSRDKKLLGQARSVLRNSDLSQSVLKNSNQHAFETTAMLRAIATARAEGGVLAPAQFLWLRGHDRTLWYPLNNLGRQSFHIEAFGAMAHYRIEKATKRPVPTPKMQEAVQSLSEYLSSRDARPIPEMDYSSSKKRGVKKAK